MTTLPAWLLFAAFAFIGGLHVYWVGGGRWGRDAAVPTLPPREGGSGPRTPAFKPGPVATLAVAVGLWLIALLVAMRAGLGAPAIEHVALQAVLGLLALVMALRAIGDFRLVGFFKTVTGSRFAWLDTRFFSPLCLLLGAGLAWVAWAG